MDSVTPTHAADHGRAIEFYGTMKEFIPIAASNAALTIVTLFIYRSWAKARERRYLWSRTRFIDEHLEWTGTGLEMFIGFVLVAILLGVGLLVFSFGIEATAIRVGPFAALGLLLALYVVGMFFYGLARCRALRYRLSRTWWRGIRGGSFEGGWDYGRKAVGYYLAAFLLAGILYPWAQAKLWNERWRKMSFGPHHFEADMSQEDTKGPFFIFWAIAVVGNLFLGIFDNPNIALIGPGAPAVVIPLLILAAIGLAYLNFLTAYYQAAVENTRIAGIEFRFSADFNDWLLFYLRTIGLAIATLGLAMFVYQFRKWQFVTSHLEALGVIDIDELTQSRTAAPKEAEGILDALDLGAF